MELGFWLLELGLEFGLGFVGGVGLASSNVLGFLSVRCRPVVGCTGERVLLLEGKKPASACCGAIKSTYTQQKMTTTVARYVAIMIVMDMDIGRY